MMNKHEDNRHTSSFTVLPNHKLLTLYLQADPARQCQVDPVDPVYPEIPYLPADG